MPVLAESNKPDPGDRKVVWMEIAAAGAIFSIVAAVLYMVFSYKPY